MGVQVPTRTPGKRAPKKIDRFRFTSADRSVIEAVAGVYGGLVHEWDNNGVGQWEVVTDATELRIALPPNPADMAWSQFYESWAKGFCSRRCDGVRDSVRDKPCDCDPENRDCKATSRLSVLLPDIAGLGVWRIESHGYYAAVELSGAIELIQQMAGVQSIIPARLRLDQREVRKLIKGKPEVFKFAVPVIDLDVSIMGVRSIAVRIGDAEVTSGEVPELPAGWAPVPDAEPPAVLSVVEQVKEATAPRKATPRKNAAAPLPATGRTPRTALEAAPEVCARCGKPYGAEALIRNPGEGGKYIHKSCPTEAPMDAGVPPEGIEGDSGGGGMVDGQASPVEPAPTAARPNDTMTHGQHKKVMAMTAALFPAEGRTGPEADAYRRDVVLGICTAIGSPGLSSRTQIDRPTAQLLIDVLDGLETGQFQWQHEDRKLIDVETGEVLNVDGGGS
jgi:hypothetical protein